MPAGALGCDALPGRHLGRRLLRRKLEKDADCHWTMPFALGISKMLLEQGFITILSCARAK
jgi:hypothetical protein